MTEQQVHMNHPERAKEAYGVQKAHLRRHVKQGPENLSVPQENIFWAVCLCYNLTWRGYTSVQAKTKS